MSVERPGGGSEGPVAEGGPAGEDREAGGGMEMERFYRSTRWRVFAIVTLAAAGIVGAGALLLLASLEWALVLVPLLLAMEFGCGFLLAGRLLALALARHHDRLRGELLAQQEQTRRALVDRWRSLDAEQREGLRRRFPDVDWGAIDDLAGTAAEAVTKH
ncbi:MAG: hypothetical protein GYA57_04830 [Myxococcales bacterium]|nr:hypothetical protein [Myxococcales bacterium]